MEVTPPTKLKFKKKNQSIKDTTILHYLTRTIYLTIYDKIKNVSFQEKKKKTKIEIDVIEFLIK